MSSDIVANHPGISPGTNPGDYDDAHFDIMEVDVFKYKYGKPLIEDGTTLTMMMRRFHHWYMETCRKQSAGKKIDTLTLKVKEDQHDLVGIEELYVPFGEFFQFFNLKALDKLTLTSYYL